MAERRRITKSVVDRLPPSSTIWDSDVIGFGVRRQKSDARIFVVKFREGSRQRWISIGRHGSPWTVEDARKRAKVILGELAKGVAPATLRDEAKQNPTLKVYAEDFLASHVDAKRKARTAASYRDLVNRLIVPELGSIQLSEVTFADVASFHRKHRRTPYQANRAVAVLSKLFSTAEREGYRPHGSNPCRHVEKFKEAKRERFLSMRELAVLGETLADREDSEDETKHAVAAIRLLIFTGARLGEILGLRWEYVDLQQAMLRLPDSKTDAKVIYLSAPALEVLANVPRLKGNPHVIAGANKGAALVNLEKPWRRIRAAATVRLWAQSDDERVAGLIADLRGADGAYPKYDQCTAVANERKLDLPPGLTDVRLHDLRHSFASVAATGGMSLPMIGKLLGHSQAQTTQRYSHLAADPVRAANEAIGERIATMLKGANDTGSIVPLKSKA